MKFGDIIRSQLDRVGWTQKRLAATVGIPPQNLNAILCGRRPLTTRMLLAIDSVLGLDLDHMESEYPGWQPKERPCST